MSNARQIALPVPGVVHGRYPERAPRPVTDFDRLGRRLSGRWLARQGGLEARRAFVSRVRAEMAVGPACGSPAFAAWVHAIRADLAGTGLRDRALARAIAAAALACSQVLGKTPFDTQIRAAAVMLDDRLAEMATGEGKTLAAFLAAAAAALAAIPVHLVTANDYLAARDSSQLGPVFACLGLTVSCATPGQTPDLRRQTYRADVVYGTAREFIFDYLRDGLAGVGAGSGLRSQLGRLAAAGNPAGLPPGAIAHKPAGEPLLRGLCFALIDEADSVLIDEARTPFVLAQTDRDEEHLAACRAALSLAGRLVSGFDFERHGARRAAELTELGRQRLAADWPTLTPAWRHQRLAASLVETALAALHLYRRDVDYVLREGKVEIVDLTTGRIAQGRRWSRGLHQMIELKEGCTPSEVQRTVAQLSFQRFFPRYLKLGGMSGTLTEARDELATVYGLAVEAVPLRQACRRVCLGVKVFAKARARWRAVIESIRLRMARGRPVLVGTDSVADSVALSRRLARLKIAHRLLHARQDGDEAAVIAQAGQAGAVTVTTNMAGRGTDILLSPAAAAAGGLHVICCQQNASARIDRQLWGRAARQGDPGSYETLLCVGSGVIESWLSAGWRQSIRRLAGADGALPAVIAAGLVAACRHLENRQARHQRTALLRHDEHIGERLAFLGERR